MESEFKSTPIFSIYSDFLIVSDFLIFPIFYPILSNFYPIFRLFLTFRLADSTVLIGIKDQLADLSRPICTSFLYSNHQVANLSASLRQEKEKIKMEMESSLHALNVVMKANQFQQSRSRFQIHLVII